MKGTEMNKNVIKNIEFVLSCTYDIVIVEQKIIHLIPGYFKDKFTCSC